MKSATAPATVIADKILIDHCQAYPGSPEGVAMEGLMLEILISLCQTGAEIYGFALGLIGIGIGTVVGVAIVVAKEEVSRK